MPHKFLFAKGETTISNTYLTIDMVTLESLRVLENQLVAAKNVNRNYDKQFGIAGAKIGTTLNVRKPPRYQGRIGTALAIEDATETSVPVVLSNQIGADLTFTSADLTLSIDKFAQRFIAPAIASVANKIDFDLLQLFSSVYNEQGTPGTLPTSLSPYLDAKTRLDEEAAPDDGQRCFILPPKAEGSLIGALTGLFNPQREIGQQYLKGSMGHAIGADWFMSQNAPTHTSGAQGGTPLVATTSVEGASTIATKGWTPSTTGVVKKGDTFTVANVFAVNPQNRQSTGSLRQFVVTADANADGSGNATISFAPVIKSTGALTQGFASGFATVDSLPQANAAITMTAAASTTYASAMLFHPDWATLASADLELPGGVDKAARIGDDDVGLSIRLVRAYDINLDHFPTRLDVLYGVAPLYPELAVRIAV